MKLPVPLYQLGSTLYLRVNAERKGLLTGLLFRPGGQITYLVSWDDPVDEKEHYACELTDTKSFGEGENEASV